MLEKKQSPRATGKPVNVYMDPSLWKECRHVAVDRKVSASQIVNEAVRAHLHALKGGE